MGYKFLLVNMGLCSEPCRNPTPGTCCSEKKVKSQSYMSGVFIRVVNSAFLQGNQLSLGWGFCEKALCGYLGLEGGTVRLSCSLSTGVLWAVPREPEWKQKLGKSHLCVCLGMSLCWGCWPRAVFPCHLCPSSRAGLSLSSGRHTEVLPAQSDGQWGEGRDTGDSTSCAHTHRSFHLIWISLGGTWGVWSQEKEEFP